MLLKSRLIIFLLLIVSIILSACSSTFDSTSPPLTESDKARIKQLLVAESEGVVNKDIDLLASLWAEDGWVVDAKHTPDEHADDTRWEGIDAILNRYITLVFPGNPSQAQHPDLSIQIDGDKATATSSTAIGNEYATQGDRWGFIRKDGQWLIQYLIYNLEPD
ncbi:MAG: hypothetical protein GXO35_09500 [Gammaproteobacteria bacterium]|nr:hypothetical protein [Gammaproteobacteria bacterium]